MVTRPVAPHGGVIETYPLQEDKAPPGSRPLTGRGLNRLTGSRIWEKGRPPHGGVIETENATFVSGLGKCRTHPRGRGLNVPFSFLLDSEIATIAPSRGRGLETRHRSD